MMHGVLRIMENRVLPYMVLVVENRYLRAIRDAFITFALPMIIAGSLFLILAFPPIPDTAYHPALAAINRWAVHYRPALMVPFQLSFGIMALFVAFGIAYNLSEIYNLEGLRTGIIAVVAFFIASVPVGVVQENGGIGWITQINLGSFLSNLGGEGLFVAIILSIFVVETVRYFHTSGFVIKMPPGVPPRVARSFEAIIPAVVVLTAVWISEWYVSTHFTVKLLDPATLQYSTVPATWPKLIMELFGPLVKASNSYPSALLQIVLMMLLWSVGIHGMNVVSAVAYPFWVQNLSANVVAASTLQPLPNIVTEPFYHIYAHLGGSGATLPLVFMLLRSRSKQLQQVGRVAIFPGIFNINEPVTFGVPIALNPIMVIPFVLGPAVIVTINYLAMSLGLVARPIAQLPFTVPIPLGGFLSNRSISGALIQLVDLAVAGAIYYPFFKIWEKKMVEREEHILEHTGTAKQGISG